MGIGFGPGAPWAAVSQFDCRRKAKTDATGPLWLRVYFAAVGWTNRVGHAEFAKGALADVLGVSGKPHAAQDVQKAIRAAKQHGLIGQESGARCLVLPRFHVQKEGLGTGSCQVHGLRTSV